MTEIIESSSVELESVNDRTLFRTDDPVEVLEAAKRVASALKAELQASGMVIRIGGSEHVKAEGWATLGAMVGVTTSIVWSRPLEDGWEARAESRTLDGRLVGAGEAMCTRAERNWAGREPFALRSMAQTRAASKALRVPLAFVMTLSGYASAPAEEMTDTTVAEPAPAELPSWARPVADLKPVAEQLEMIMRAMDSPAPRRSATQIGERLYSECGDLIPEIVLSVLEEVLVESTFAEEKSS